MRIRHAPEGDALSVIFREATVTTKELTDGIVAEYDVGDQLVGPEILDAGKRFGDPSTFREVILEGVGLATPRAVAAIAETR